MVVPPPAEIQGIKATSVDLENKFKTAERANVDFLLFVHDDAETQMHPVFKYMERRYNITTQVRLLGFTSSS